MGWLGHVPNDWRFNLEKWKEFWTDHSIFLFWACMYGPDWELTAELKYIALEVLYQLVVDIVVYLILPPYHALVEVCRKWNLMLVQLEKVIWTLTVREPWFIITGRRNESFRRLYLSGYYTTVWGPRFLVHFYHELRFNMGLLSRQAEFLRGIDRVR